MPTLTVIIVLAVAGALCLALMAAGTRRLPGGWHWNGFGRDKRQEAEQSYARRLVGQHVLLQVLEDRFGVLPPGVVTRVESEDPEWCEEMAIRVMTAETLEELGL